MSVDAIVESFEIASERAGDVAPAIYDAYFARCPESRELMRYVDKHMRGRMLDSVFTLLMSVETSDEFRYLQFEAAAHSSYGVLPHMYGNLLAAVEDTIRQSCGSSWTSAMSVAWNTRLDTLLREIRSTAEPAVA